MNEENEIKEGEGVVEKLNVYWLKGGRVWEISKCEK
jgi:hypothetical protein